MFWAAVAGGYLALIGLVMALGRAVKRADAFDEACFEESQRRRKNRAPGWEGRDQARGRWRGDLTGSNEDRGDA